MENTGLFFPDIDSAILVCDSVCADLHFIAVSETACRNHQQTGFSKAACHLVLDMVVFSDRDTGICLWRNGY